MSCGARCDPVPPHPGLGFLLLLLTDGPAAPVSGDTGEEGQGLEVQGTQDTYPGVAGSEPRGLHGPAGDGAGGHHLRQDGPIAAFFIVIRVPGRRRR